jgi:hypothetical protein
MEQASAQLEYESSLASAEEKGPNRNVSNGLLGEKLIGFSKPVIFVSLKHIQPSANHKHGMRIFVMIACPGGSSDCSLCYESTDASSCYMW